MSQVWVVCLGALQKWNPGPNCRPGRVDWLYPRPKATFGRLVYFSLCFAKAPPMMFSELGAGATPHIGIEPLKKGCPCVGSTRISRRFVGKSAFGGPSFWVPFEFVAGGVRPFDRSTCLRGSYGDWMIWMVRRLSLGEAPSFGLGW